MPQVAAQLAKSYLRITRHLPARNMLAIACAIVALENARGFAILGHNYGNIAWVGQTPDYWEHPKPSAGAPLYFAVYPTHDAGAEAWWRLMLRKYPSVLIAGLGGDPKAAVHEQYRRGYVQALSAGEEQRYANAVASYYSQALSDWIPKSGVYAGGWIAPLALVVGGAAAAYVVVRARRKAA